MAKNEEFWEGLEKAAREDGWVVASEEVFFEAVRRRAEACADPRARFRRPKTIRDATRAGKRTRRHRSAQRFFTRPVDERTHG